MGRERQVRVGPEGCQGIMDPCIVDQSRFSHPSSNQNRPFSFPKWITFRVTCVTLDLQYVHSQEPSSPDHISEATMPPLSPPVLSLLASKPLGLVGVIHIVLQPDYTSQHALLQEVRWRATVPLPAVVRCCEIGSWQSQLPHTLSRGLHEQVQRNLLSDSVSEI